MLKNPFMPRGEARGAQVVAELIINRRNSEVLLVQVRQDASFHDFYLLCVRVGEVASARNRNWNTRGTVEIEEIPALLDRTAWKSELEVASWKVAYPDREKYLELLHCDPSKLGKGLAYTDGGGDEWMGWLHGRRTVRVRYEDSSMKRRLERVFK